jgi:hypothetical protein
VVAATRGLHSYDARRQLAHEPKKLSSVKSLPSDGDAFAIEANQMKPVLSDINADRN